MTLKQNTFAELRTTLRLENAHDGTALGALNLTSPVRDGLSVLLFKGGREICESHPLPTRLSFIYVYINYLAWFEFVQLFFADIKVLIDVLFDNVELIDLAGLRKAFIKLVVSLTLSSLFWVNLYTSLLTLLLFSEKVLGAHIFILIIIVLAHRPSPSR